MRFSYFITFFITLFYCDLFACLSHGNIFRRNKNATLERIRAKIVGGKAVPIEQYAFAAQVLNMGRLCGGVILNSWTVITAAHCIMFNLDTDVMAVLVGARYTYDFDADRYRVSSFVIHEDYNKEQPFSCDIALVFVEKSIKFGERVKKGILVTHDKWMNERETNFIVTGWGHTKQSGEVSKVGIQMARLRYIRSGKCSKFLDGHRITRDMFCLYGGGKRDTCQGDSGGGVLWNGVLVGLTSHGDGCAHKNRPSVYTNLWVLRKWIKKQVYYFLEQYCNNKIRSNRAEGTDS